MLDSGLFLSEKNGPQPFKNETQTTLFKDPVRTAQ